MSSSVLEKVRTVAADVLQLPIDRITPDSSPEQIESWDSVQHLNLVLALEETFGVQLEPEEIEQMKSIRQIATLVESKTGQNA